MKKTSLPFSTFLILALSITGTASREIPEFSLTPRIYKITPTADVLMFTGEPKSCTIGTTCTLSGTFVPAVWDFSHVTSKYFTNATVSFTSSRSYKLFSVIAGDSGANRADIIPLSVQPADAVPEVIVTGPLSPVKPRTMVGTENVNNSVPWGGTIEHVMNLDVPTTIVYDASGKPQYRVDDNMAAKIAVPGNKKLPVTRVYVIPSEAIVNQSSQQKIIVDDPTRQDSVVTVKSEASTGGSSLLSSSSEDLSGVYYVNKGGECTFGYRKQCIYDVPYRKTHRSITRIRPFI